MVIYERESQVIGLSLFTYRINSNMQSLQQTSTLNEYRVGKTVGEGTFGKVKIATHVPTNSTVAIKCLEKAKINDQADIQRITREICILKMLHHPNVAQLYEIIETTSEIHLVMEYAEGGELFDYIVNHKRLQEKEAVKFMKQLMSGLQYIHRNGVVHRDLKPQNLLLDSNNHIKIVDFGLSNQFKPQQRLKTACGSPCYAAPQMISGKRYECTGVDIWSCGIILYAMLCGHLPFEDSDIHNLYKKILSGYLQLPQYLSLDAVTIIKGMLNIEPERRWTIKDIKACRWMNSIQYSYTVNGIMMRIDRIEVNENVVEMMKDKGFDVNLVKDYVRNNRHNNVTAFYYYLCQKYQHQYSPNKVVKQLTIQNGRNNSPLIYRPNNAIKPQMRFIHQKQDRDRSLNATAIVQSLMKANKQKLSLKPAIKQSEGFDYAVNSKAFPIRKPQSTSQCSNSQTVSLRESPKKKTNQKAQQLLQYSHRRPAISFEVSSKPVGIHHHSHQNSPVAKTPHLNSHFIVQTPRSRKTTFNQQSISKSQKPSIFSQSPIEFPPSNQKQGINFEDGFDRLDDISRKREELSQQLKLISEQIDQSINSLRKQSNTMSNSTNLTNLQMQSRKKYDQNIGQRIKTQMNPTSFTFSFTPISRRVQSIEIFESSFSKDLKTFEATLNKKDLLTKQPRYLSGPFNVNCLFHEQARSLILKIQTFLRKQRKQYKCLNNFVMQTEGITINLQRIEADDFNLLTFSKVPEWSSNLVAFLDG